MSPKALIISSTRRPIAACVSAFILGALFALGCASEPDERAFVVRLGDQLLTQEEIESALATLPPHQDSVQAYEQFIENWVTNQLLAREARRRKLESDPEVIRLLKDNEQSVLISTLVNQLYEKTPEPTSNDVRTYFERNRDRLHLREPFIHIRYLSSSDSSKIGAAYTTFTTSAAENKDSLWQAIITNFADDAEAALALSSNYFSERRLLGTHAALRQLLNQLDRDEISPPIHTDGVYHIVQVVDRLPEGTAPKLEWVEDEIRQRLRIQSRKQMYADQVQRLKNEAFARDLLEIRNQR